MALLNVSILIILLNLAIAPFIYAESTIKKYPEGYSEQCFSFNPANLTTTDDSPIAKAAKARIWCATEKGSEPPVSICCNADRSEHEKCLAVIKNNGANQSCRTYGGGPALMYYLASGNPIVGPMVHNEDCDVFLPETLKIKEFSVNKSSIFPEGRFWQVTNGDDWIYQQYLATKQIAEVLQSIIQKHGFTHLCRNPFSMRRADSSELELLKSGKLRPGLRESCFSFNPANLVTEGRCAVDKLAKSKVQLCCGQGKPDESCLEFMKSQGITQKCMSDLDYYLASGRAPQGPIPGEKCGILFDPNDIQITGLDVMNKDEKNAQRKFKYNRIYWITSKSDRVYSWEASSLAMAERQVGIIKKYGFTRQCNLSTISYWRNSRPDVPENPNTVPYEGCVKFNSSRLKPHVAGREYAVTYDVSKKLFQRGFNKNSYERWVKIMKHYEINEVCFIGRAKDVHGLKIFFASGEVPKGSYPGEYCKSFNPGNLSIKQGQRSSDDYILLDGDKEIYRFGGSSPLNVALKTVELIKQHGITHMCFGSPNSMEISTSALDAYFRK